MDENFLFLRENPFYSRMKDTWRHNNAAYSGGKEYIKEALIKHLSEIQTEYNERVKRAYYFNYPRKIAKLITQYVLSVRPERQNADSTLVEDWTRTGLRVDEVMRQVSTYLNIFGCAWLSVDMPSFDGVPSKADEIKEKLRPYCTALSPLCVKDWCYGSDNNLDWLLVSENAIDNSNPFETPISLDIRKLWTRNDVTIFTLRSDNYPVPPVTIEHRLGVVPFIRVTEIDGYGIHANHWFDDVVLISDAIMNNESEAQMNTVKQMFGLLVVGESFLNGIDIQTDSSNNPDEISVSKVIARSAAICECAEEKGVSRYISPSGIETQTIRNENQALMKMMFECAMLATGKDTRMIESADSKMWDFQAIEQYLRTRADILEQCEYRAWELMKKWNESISLPTISYNRNFAILELKESVATLLELSGFNVENEDYQKEINKTAVVLLNRLRQLSQESHERINNIIDSEKNVNIDKNI